MRRIDAIAISLAIFLGGGLVFFLLQVVGLDGINAGIWTQVILVVGLLGWASTYLFRVLGKNMTYNKQMKDYEEAVMQKRLEEMSPEDLAKLQAEIAQEKASEQKDKASDSWILFADILSESLRVAKISSGVNPIYHQ